MALRKARAAVASTAEVEAVAEELLGRGNAVDAVVAGVFAASAISAGVLLGPVQVLVAGAGAGSLAVDGRVRQPGIGAPRPRGFTSAEEIPGGAWVGVPWLPATLSVAVATMGTATFNQVLSPAVALAKGTPRKDVLARIASRGPRALEEGPLSTELLASAGRASGGLLTPDDLASPHPDVVKATRTTFGGPIKKTEAETTEPKLITTAPWTHIDGSLPAPPAHRADIACVRGVAAVDRNGTFAVACWEESTDGIFIEELGLRAPSRAEPVRRGQTRIRPGEPRAAGAPMALIGTAASPEMVLCAFGAADAFTVLGQALEGYATESRIDVHGEARLVALAHANGTASVLRS